MSLTHGHVVQFSNTTTAVRCSILESRVEEITFNVKGFLDTVQYDVAYALNTSIHRVALPEHQFDGSLSLDALLSK